MVTQPDYIDAPLLPKEGSVAEVRLRLAALEAELEAAEREEEGWPKFIDLTMYPGNESSWEAVEATIIECGFFDPSKVTEEDNGINWEDPLVSDLYALTEHAGNNMTVTYSIDHDGSVKLFGVSSGYGRLGGNAQPILEERRKVARARRLAAKEKK